MLNVILIFAGNEVFESSSNPFVRVDLFGFLFVIHSNSVIILEVIFELIGFLELLEEKFMKLVLTRAVLGVHFLKNPIE